tara:strand:- start:142 stop:570 length:429 start_codon:yes stop_codon:yes gene_type:complete
MKKVILVLTVLALSLTMNAQSSSSKTLVSWLMGTQKIVEFNGGEHYSFIFQNAKYTITDIESVSIGDKEGLIKFTNLIDSLMNKVVLEKGESQSYSINDGRLSLTKSLGVNTLTIWSEHDLGYTGLSKFHVKKLRKVLAKLE